MRIGAGVPRRQQCLAGRRPRSGCGVLPHRLSSGAGQSQLQDRARARDARRLPGPLRQGASLRGPGSAGSGAGRVPAGERVRPDQPPGGRQGRLARSDHPRSHRSRATQAGHRATAGTRAGRLGAAHAEPGFPGAAHRSIQRREPARHPELHRQPDRHQHHLRPRRPGSGGHGRPRGRDARAGARPADDDEPDVVQGPLRSLDLRVPGHAAETCAVPTTR